jgi:anti-sigma regulatory factor (Ser/Thr protein kinase)
MRPGPSPVGRDRPPCVSPPVNAHHSAGAHGTRELGDGTKLVGSVLATSRGAPGEFRDPEPPGFIRLGASLVSGSGGKTWVGLRRTIERVGRILHEAIQLPDNQASPARARRFIREALPDLPDDFVDRAQLLISELVTNAVLHGRPPVHAELEIGPSSLSVAVIDQGSEAPTLHDPTALDDHGRGLRIVGQLADEWGVEWRTQGKSVWFRLGTAFGLMLSMN